MWEVSGVEFEYYFVCKTQLWLFSHNIQKTEDDENVKIGKLIHQNIYKRGFRDRSIARTKFDVIRRGDVYTVYERKKNKILPAHEWQLKYYLYTLRINGIKSVGILIAPGYRKIIHLRKEDIKTIEEVKAEIRKIISLPNPPVPKKIGRCKNCAYHLFCFGDEDE